MNRIISHNCGTSKCILKNCVSPEMFLCLPVKKAGVCAILLAHKVSGQSKAQLTKRQEILRDVCSRVFADTLMSWPHLWRRPPVRNKRILYWHNSEEAKEVQQSETTGMSVSQMWQFSGPHARAASQCPLRVTCCSSPTAGNHFSRSLFQCTKVRLSTCYECKRCAL